MRTMTLCNVALLGIALFAPLGTTVLRAADQKVVVRTYHDKQHNDDHQWNGQEDKAYRNVR